MLEFMKNKILIPAIIILGLGVFFSFRYAGEKNKGAEEEQQTILQTVMAIMEQGHFSPRPIDDRFSQSIFDRTIESLDYEKKFFTIQDYERLKTSYRNNIDDEIKNNSLAFFDDVNNLFIQRVNDAEKFYPEILKTPFDFSQSDSLQLDGKKLEFVNNGTALKDRWEAYLKYRVLSKYEDLKEAEEKKVKDSSNYKAKSFSTLEKEARESIGKIQDRYFKRLKKLNDNDRFALFMNSITAAEDPHSDYLPPADKKRFDEMMSGSFIGIGASLQQQEDGRVKINAIITGSPSWKQGKLKANDEILKVAQGDEAPVDVEGMDLEDVVKIIRGPEGTEVRLSVKHADGTSEIIPIIRGKVELEDLYAKSAIIENAGKKIGYIYLPEFYADFNGITGRRCADDVAAEVKKLKAENIDGIVLDLRNNGGGSLSDVVDMAGIFVGSGPVVQVMTSGHNTQTLSNKAGTPLYTGPLAIMVNGGSASASEIMAAAMQDYGRAVIIGSKTFGKGTVQKLVPLDRFVNNSMRERIVAAFNEAKGGGAEYDGIGSLKLTIQKFYRINGGSTQLKGVTPDIELPDPYTFLDLGERKETSALPWDKIAPAPYHIWDNAPPVELLIKNSQSRIAANETFNLIGQTAQKLKVQQDNNIVPLNKNQFEKKQAETEALTQKMDKLDSMGGALLVTNLKTDLPKVNVDTVSRSKNEDWLKTIKKDIYVYETTNVLNDWINASAKIVQMQSKN